MDSDDDPFASDVEANLEGDEGAIEDEQSKLQLTIASVNKLHLCANHTKVTGLVIFEPAHIHTLDFSLPVEQFTQASGE